MKNLFILLIATLLSTGVNAQTTDTKKTEKPAVKKETKYCCPQCDYCSLKKDTCPYHKVALVASETETKYCCSHCDWTLSPVKGKCPPSTYTIAKDGELYCVICHDKGGKCPTCGMEMKKMEVKKKKKEAKKE